MKTKESRRHGDLTKGSLCPLHVSVTRWFNFAGFRVRASRTSDDPIAMRHSLPKSRHLRSPAEFAAVYDARVRESRGPLMAYAKPNDLGYPRLGMSVSRKVGIAVRRN